MLKHKGFDSIKFIPGLFQQVRASTLFTYGFTLIFYLTLYLMNDIMNKILKHEVKGSDDLFYQFAFEQIY